MYTKLSLRNLNSDSCLPYLISTYSFEMTITPRVHGDSKYFNRSVDVKKEKKSVLNTL